MENISKIIKATREYLSLAEEPQFLSDVVKKLEITAEEAQNAMKELNKRGEIELMPSAFGARYKLIKVDEPPRLAPARKFINKKLSEPAPQINKPTKVSIKAIPKPAPAKEAASAGAIIEQETSTQMYLLHIPKRKPRLFLSSDKAVRYANAAVRNGVHSAKVYELVPYGKARRDAKFHLFGAQQEGTAC